MKQPQIYIVDDESGVAQMCADYLKPTYTVRIFLSAKEVLEEFSHSSQPDLIITDILMPEMDGVEFAEHLKAKGYLKPVLMMSAHAKKSHAIEALEQGVEGFLEKPFEPSQLKKMIQKVLLKKDRNELKEQLIVKYCELAGAALVLSKKYKNRYLRAEGALIKSSVPLNTTHEKTALFLQEIQSELELEQELDQLTLDIKKLLIATEETLF